jgi:hypothetical protein
MPLNHDNVFQHLIVDVRRAMNAVYDYGIRELILSAGVAVSIATKMFSPFKPNANASHCA